MPTLPEEIVLLALDEKAGTLMLLPERSLDFALAGAMMIELSMRGKLETVDDVFLKVSSREPTNDKILDDALQIIPDTPHLTIENALARIARKGGAWVDRLFDSLVEKEILERREDRFLWIVRESTFSLKDHKLLDNLRLHIRGAVMSEGEELAASDAALIALMDACKISFTIFSDKELAKYSKRFDEISKINPIARAVSLAISEIENAILEVIAFTGV
ncbi:MAG: GPP34 family phosphoprotein [Opitutales bacterium]|nr:GPP34 family phosphoprotein [Opitutales bacterium]